MKSESPDHFDRSTDVKPRKSLSFIVFLTLAVALAGVALFYWLRSTQPAPRLIAPGKPSRLRDFVDPPVKENLGVPAPDGEELERCRELVSTQMAHWGNPTNEGEGVDDPVGRERLFHRYFGFLSLEGLNEEALNQPSPETAFLGRLPKTPLGMSEKFDDPTKLRKRLAELVGKLEPASKIDGSASDLLNEVARLMDYDRWKRTDPVWSKLNLPKGDPAPVDPGLAGLVDRFRGGSRR
jgi:hypothetical protein